MLIITILIIYFLTIFFIGKAVGNGGDNNTFFRGNRQSPWYLVAFGMVGASISGVSFVSVPGMVINSDMTYLQTCIGFIFGYFVVAFVLLPLYYKLNLTSIYSYLGTRFGQKSYLTGASFFILSKFTGSAVKFYVVCMIIHQFVFAQLGVPFIVTVVGMVTLIWLYTKQGGIKTLVITDTIQTACMLTALAIITFNVVSLLGFSLPETFETIANDSHSKIFVFDDWASKQNFWKQFFSGIFIVIVMTGLDQDMMQKNLTCKTLKDAQKDMCSYGMAFLPVNFLFLALGILLITLANKQGYALPNSPDVLLPFFAATGKLGTTATIFFTLGIIAASFSSADSALTSLTTSYCVDIKQRPADITLRKRTHIAMCLAFVAFILLFDSINTASLIDTIYVICSYTYGPILGLFAFGMFSKRGINDKATPYIAIASPIICYLIKIASSKWLGYDFGYELLMLNGAITFIGLWLSHKKA